MAHLEEYRKGVEKIRDFSRSRNIPDFQVKAIFEAVLERYEKREQNRCSNFRFSLKICLVILSFVLLYLANLDKKFFTATIVRNLQNSIYPGLKIVRKFAVPIVQRYPSLSELYDEWCLLENPYFYVNEIDCWPCTVVKSVPDLTGQNISRSFNLGIPYTKSEKNTRIKVQDFYDLLSKNLDIFLDDAAKVTSNNSTFATIKDVEENNFESNPSKLRTNRVTWRINRMKPGRLVRKLFPKPIETPDWWEQSIEKYVFIDEPMAPPYSLPNPECSNVVIRCAAGARLIKMIPSPECSQSCESSTILLSNGNTLWFNWWYWRPISLPPTNASAVSINYLISFC